MEVLYNVSYVGVPKTDAISRKIAIAELERLIPVYPDTTFENGRGQGICEAIARLRHIVAEPEKIETGGESMKKYITEEIINDFNKELEMAGSNIRYDFYDDPDGFTVCNRGKLRTLDVFIESASIMKLTDKFYEFVMDTFKRKYDLDVRVCDITGNIWIADAE